MLEKILKLLDSEGVRSRVAYTTFYVTLSSAVKTVHEAVTPLWTDGGWITFETLLFLTVHVLLTAIWIIKFYQPKSRIPLLENFVSRVFKPKKEDD